METCTGIMRVTKQGETRFQFVEGLSSACVFLCAGRSFSPRHLRGRCLPHVPRDSALVA